MTKKCITCGEIKFSTEFYNKHSECKLCNQARSRKWKLANRERSLQRFKEYRAAHKKEHADQMRKWRKENRERAIETGFEYRENHRSELQLRSRKYRKANQEKEYAHGVIKNLLKFGKIQRPDTCSKCGSSLNIIAHHPDYSKPKDIIWICQSCHLAIHKGKYMTAAEVGCPLTEGE
jgi:hypothetical protein